MFGTTEAGTSKREQGQRRMGSAREDELGKVRYKPEEPKNVVSTIISTGKPNF